MVSSGMFLIISDQILLGNKAPLAVKNKGAYMIADLKANNAFWGLNLNFPKDFKTWIKTQSSAPAQKILLAIQEKHPELLETTSRHYWNRIWSKSLPIFSAEDHESVRENDDNKCVRYQVLKAAGIKDHSEIITLSSKEKYGDLLKKNTNAAIELKAFGAPWIVVHKDGQEHCYFGSDRFHLIGHLIGEEFTNGKIVHAAKL